MLLVIISYPLRSEVAGEGGTLVGVKALATVQELRQEGGVEIVEVDGGHVVDGHGDVVLQQVVALVQEYLKQHVDEMEQHGALEQLLESRHANTHRHTHKT